jgi:hypothetical protein
MITDYPLVWEPLDGGHHHCGIGGQLLFMQAPAGVERPPDALDVGRRTIFKSINVGPRLVFLAPYRLRQLEL